jgi:hypothetical protein
MHIIEIQHSLSPLLCGILVEVLIMKSLKSGSLPWGLSGLAVGAATDK